VAGEPHVILKRVLAQCGSAFGLLALFGLGMGIVGNLDSIASKGIALPLMLICLKSFVLPLLEKIVADLVLRDEMISRILWVSGTIGTAASTSLVVSGFLPMVGAMFRGATVLNLVMSLPLLLVAATLFTSELENRLLLLDYTRQWSGIGSMVSIIILLVTFIVVRRWRRYPMLLLIDLVIMGFPFYFGHYFCGVAGLDGWNRSLWEVLYCFTNIGRLFRRAYMVGLCFLLALQVRWDRVFPSIPYGYQADKEDYQHTGSGHGPYHEKMKCLHWFNRALSLIYALLGTVPIMLFGEVPSNSGLNCWIPYGTAQWWQEGIFFIISTLLSGLGLSFYLCSEGLGQDVEVKMYRGVKFRFAFLLSLQFISLATHTVLIIVVLSGSQTNFEENRTWIQPLVVLIVTTDGGGFVLMLIFMTSTVVRLVYKRLCYSCWVHLTFRSLRDNLKWYAFKMAADPELIIMNHHADHREQSQRFPDHCTGAAAVDWMLEHGDCVSREEARQRCTEMCMARLLVGIKDQPLAPFVDATDYRYEIRVPQLVPFLHRTQEQSTEEASSNDKTSSSAGDSISGEVEAVSDDDDSDSESTLSSESTDGPVPPEKTTVSSKSVAVTAPLNSSPTAVAPGRRPSSSPYPMHDSFGYTALI